jgi:hypothetical protein
MGSLSRFARVAVFGLGLLLPFHVNGQAASAPRPEYRVTRFDEDWSVLQGGAERGGLDALKYVSLADSSAIYLSIGGQLRYRMEGVRNFLLDDAPERSDEFGLTRALLHADLHLSWPLRVFLEGKQAVAHGRDLPGGTRPLDQDEWELQNAFVDVACCGPAPVAGLRIGRQELLLGSQRLLSPLDWTNTRRTFEGAKLTGRFEGFVLDAFWTRPVIIRLDAANTRDDDAVFTGITFRPATPGSIAWETYLLRLEQGEGTRLWGREGEHDRITIGGRAAKALGSGATRVEIEGAWQGGTLADETISAFFVASDITRSFAALWSRPTLGVGLDYASGDDAPEDGRAGTFHQLFPLAHAFAGYMDILGRQNLTEIRAVATAAPAAPLQLRLSGHHFLRASDADGAYAVGGGELRPAAGLAERSIGSEVDMLATFRASPHSRLEVGYGHFFPGAFMTESASGATGSDWVYAAVVFTF